MIIQNDYGFKELKHKTLKEYFSTIKDIQERNCIILLALEDGYTQAEIGRCIIKTHYVLIYGYCGDCSRSI